MTNSFSHVLGKGGFETVYKGKLSDGSGTDVAVKILKDSKGEWRKVHQQSNKRHRLLILLESNKLYNDCDR
ncbi:hypothetical protein YC2023_119774 [Brassica napus]